MKGFVSDSNVPSFWYERRCFVQHLFEVPHCLTQVAEVLCVVLAQSQPGWFFDSAGVVF